MSVILQLLHIQVWRVEGKRSWKHKHSMPYQVSVKTLNYIIIMLCILCHSCVLLSVIIYFVLCVCVAVNTYVYAPILGSRCYQLYTPNPQIMNTNGILAMWVYMTLLFMILIEDVSIRGYEKFAYFLRARIHNIKLMCKYT